MTRFDLIYALLLLLFLAAIAFYGIVFERVQEGKSVEICQRLNNLRGLFAIEIVIGHVIRYDRTFLYPMGKFMIISVAFFFFVSAFGMVQSFQGKERYLDNFLFPKTGYLFCLAVIIYLINVLTDYIVPFKLHYFETWDCFFTNFPVMTNWYLWEQIFFYLLFYFVYKYLKKYRIMLITVIVFLLAGVVFCAGWIEGYYASALAFPFGLLYGEHYEKCQKIMHSFLGKAAVIVMVIMGLSSLLFKENSLLGMVYLRNIMCVSSMVILAIIVEYFSFDNKILRFLGRHSAEIYLVQFVFLRLTEAMRLDYKLRIPIVICGTLLAAIILYPLFVYIKKLIYSISVSKSA